MKPTHSIDLNQLLEHASWARELAHRLVGESAADDLVQETWLAALRRPPSGDRALRPWLATVLGNLARNRARRLGRRREHEQAGSRPEALPSAATLTERTESLRLLIEALLELEPEMRQLVLLRFFEGYSAVEIARLQGVPVTTVRSQLERGLTQLRGILDKRQGGNRESWSLALVPLLRIKPPAAAIGMGTATTFSPLVLMKTVSLPVASLFGLLFCTLGFFAMDPLGIASDENMPKTKPSELALAPRMSLEDTPPPQVDEPGARRSVIPSELIPESQSGQPQTMTAIRTITESGSVLPGAEVWRLDGDHPEFLGTTDLDGSLSGDLGLGESISLQANSEGWLSSPMTFLVDEVSSLDLLLVETAAIHGRVVLPNGLAAGEGVQVLLSRSGQALTNRLARDEYHCTTLGRLVETDRDGHFVFRNLVFDGKYDMTAGGHGLVNASPLRHVEVGGSDAVLEVEYGYAALVKLRDAGGGLPIFSEDLATRYGGRIQMPKGVECQGLMGYTPASFLAGLAVPEEELASRMSQIIIATSPKQFEELGTIGVFFELPGYEDLQAEFDASPIGSDLPVYEFSVERVAPGHGGLRLVFEGLSPSLEENGAHLAWASLKLRSETESLTFSVPALSSEGVLIEKIPHGIYELTLSMAKGLHQEPALGAPEAVVTISNTVFEYALDASGFAGIEFVVHKADGAPYQGALGLNLAPRENVLITESSLQVSGISPVYFEAPPYVVVGIPAREIAAIPFKPFTRFVELPTVVMEKGEIVKLHIREKP